MNRHDSAKRKLVQAAKSFIGAILFIALVAIGHTVTTNDDYPSPEIVMPNQPLTQEQMAMLQDLHNPVKP